MKCAMQRRLTQPPGVWVTLSPSERADVNAERAALRAEVRRLRLEVAAHRGFLTPHELRLYDVGRAQAAAFAPRKTRGTRK